MLCKQLQRGAINTLSIYWCRKRSSGVQIYRGGERPFLHLGNILSPRRKLQYQNFQGVRGLFEILKMFYPPEGWCGSTLQGVHLILFPFIGVGNGSGGFQIYMRCEAFPKILKMFYSPEGLCRAEPEGGPIVLLSILLV